MPTRTITVTTPGSVIQNLTGGAGIVITGSTINITAAGVVSTMLAAGAVTNAAIALNAVAGNNLNSAGIAQTFTGNVVFLNSASIIFGGSSGSDPLLVINNTSLTLFSANNGASTPAGLTANPYVQVESTGILVSSGGTGPSTVIGTFTGGSGSTNGVVFWSVNASLTHPYVAMDSNGITLSYSATAQATLSGFGFQVINGSYSVLIFSTTISLTGPGGALTLTSSQIQLSNGNCSFTATTSALTIQSGSAGGNHQIVVSSSSVAISNTTSAFGSITIALGSLQAGATLSAGVGGGIAFIGGNASGSGGAALITLGSTTFPGYCTMSCAPPAFSLVVNGQQLLTSRQTGLGNPSGFADAVAQSYIQALYNKIVNHGFIT